MTSLTPLKDVSDRLLTRPPLMQQSSTNQTNLAASQMPKPPPTSSSQRTPQLRAKSSRKLLIESVHKVGSKRLSIMNGTGKFQSTMNELNVQKGSLNGNTNETSSKTNSMENDLKSLSEGKISLEEVQAHSNRGKTLSALKAYVKKITGSGCAMSIVVDKVLYIIRTLRRPPDERSNSDVKMLYIWLMHQENLSSLFTTMSDVSAQKLCKEMEFCHLHAKDVLVHQGEKGNTCFILVTGCVGVYIRNAEEQQRHQRALARRNSLSEPVTDEYTINYGPMVTKLTSGATFGELCLIEPDSKRSATIIVESPVANFIILTAAAYMRVTRSQSLVGSITDHINFLQSMILFRTWTKMRMMHRIGTILWTYYTLLTMLVWIELMHLVNSMKLICVAAGQYIVRKGSEADSFFIFLRGEAKECMKILVDQKSETRSNEGRAPQHCIAVDLTYLGKFDFAGEYIVSRRKTVLCPIDIRAITDVNCLVLNRKLFALHFNIKDQSKQYAAQALRIICSTAQTRQLWRETRMNEALTYPHIRVPISRKIMRLSGCYCTICGRSTHVAGDDICLNINLEGDKGKSRSRHFDAHNRILKSHKDSVQNPETIRSPDSRHGSVLPGGSDTTDKVETSQPTRHFDSRSRLGMQLVSKQWNSTERSAVVLRTAQRPSTTPGTRMPLYVPQQDQQMLSPTQNQGTKKQDRIDSSPSRNDFENKLLLMRGSRS